MAAVTIWRIHVKMQGMNLASLLCSTLLWSNSLYGYAFCHFQVVRQARLSVQSSHYRYFSGDSGRFIIRLATSRVCCVPSCPHSTSVCIVSATTHHRPHGHHRKCIVSFRQQDDRRFLLCAMPWKQWNLHVSIDMYQEEVFGIFHWWLGHCCQVLRSHTGSLFWGCHWWVNDGLILLHVQIGLK